MLFIINTQKAVFEKLTAALTQKIYDFVPEDASLPYVTIGDFQLQNTPQIGKNVYEVNLNIRAYDNSVGRKNLLLIADDIFGALNKKTLVIDGFVHVETELTTQEIKLIADGKKYQMDANYKIMATDY